jgi:4-hydroxybutyryl-CoA dehydratase/vinylacetyl-CoA-Delta-isomerase
MPLMTADAYRESLRDGRVVFWGGEQIEDVTRHPRFQVPLKVAMGDYAYDDPALRPILTYETEEGTTAHRIYQVPRTAEDLMARVELCKRMSLVGGTTGVFMALLTIKDRLAALNPMYAANVERLYRHARDNDLRAAEVITDAKGDRAKRAHEQVDPDLYLRIVERRADGIVVRGAKLHITGASVVHELVVMPTKAMNADEADYAVAFSVPANTKGVAIINRNFAPAELNAFDYPGSVHASLPEGFVVFDDVFVPWDRVFLAGEHQLSAAFAQSLGLWERTLGLVEGLHRIEIMVGLAQLVAEHQGRAKESSSQETIADMIAYVEAVRMGLDYSCRNFETTPSGMVHPNTLGINVTKYNFVNEYHRFVRNLLTLSGGIVMTLPQEADLRNQASGAYLRKYMQSVPGVDVELQMRVLNLIRDMTADAYGGWNMVMTLQAGGGLKAQRIMMARGFDMAAAKAKALAHAGVASGA